MPGPVVHDEEVVRCASPICIQPNVPKEKLHPTGLCAICCQIRGDLGCPLCPWGDDL